MSTRAVVKFCYGKEVAATIYRHSDGYPEGLGKDLHQFFAEVEEETNDTRFDHTDYLAAKWVVWDSQQGDAIRLDFLGVGIVAHDPADIEYQYLLDCENLTEGRPTITIKKRQGWERPRWITVEDTSLAAA